MSFKDCFDINSVLFSPILYYEGEWLLDCSYGLGRGENLFSLNEKEKNIFNKYLKKYFYRPLSMIYNSESMVENFSAKIVISTDEEIGKKTIRFNYSTFVFEIISLVFKKINIYVINFFRTISLFFLFKKYIYLNKPI